MVRIRTTATTLMIIQAYLFLGGYLVICVPIHGINDSLILVKTKSVLTRKQPKQAYHMRQIFDQIPSQH